MQCFSAFRALSALALVLTSWLPQRVSAQALSGTLVAGPYHTAALRADGTIWGWGDNSDGQLGTGSVSPQSAAPAKAGTADNWKLLAGTGSHSLAIRADGTLWAWGNNANGQVGNGAAAASQPSPVQVGSVNTWKAVAAGTAHSLAIRADGTLWAWGSNTAGQLGDNTHNQRLQPVQIGTNASWIAVAAGSTHSLALRANGTLWAWGGNTDGQLGDNTQTERPQPVQVGSATTWTAVAAGADHSVALRADGSLWTWGYNGYGQLGDATSAARRLVPVPVSVGAVWVAIGAGGTNTVGVQADGTLWAWGYNGSQQLGDGTQNASHAPLKVGSGNDWVAATCGFNHVVALKADGTIWTLGSNSKGQFGSGTAGTPDSPTPVLLPGFQGLPTRCLSAGYEHGLALRPNGTLVAWGNNPFGEIGDGSSNVPRRSPVPVGTATTWKQVAASPYHHSAGVQADGTLWTWGSNNNGQLGDGTVNTTRLTPGAVGPGTRWVAVATGIGHTVGLTASGTINCWGDNSLNQLGDNSYVSQRATPTALASPNANWKAVATGDHHSLAIRADGTLWAWGSNSNGQLGDGTQTRPPKPVQVGSGNTWVAVAAGYVHTVALRADGSLWTWGYNGYGQLGNGDNTHQDRSAPVRIGSGNSWIAVAAGTYHTLALRADGTVWGWGYNFSGQLGLNDATGRNAPVQEFTQATKWVALAGGGAFSLLRTSSGYSFASSGDNTNGQTGDGTPAANYYRFDRLQPLPVTLVSFAARRRTPELVQLTWQTAQEQANAGFQVEKSTDAQQWQALEFVAGAGTSTTVRTYTYADRAATQAAYYRLRQRDYDGQTSVSAVQFVTAPGAVALVLRPNPASGRRVHVGGSDLTAPVQLLTARGELVRQWPAGTPDLDLDGVAAGFYVVRVGRQASRLLVE